MNHFPAHAQITEEGPREGFQFEGENVSTAAKVELIDALSRSGLTQIQVVSFVNPKRVPGMADAAEVAARLTPFDGVTYKALWLNEQGLKRGLAAPNVSVSGRVVLCASAPFLARNMRMTPEQARQEVCNAIDVCRAQGVEISHGGVQAAFGCNFGGELSVDVVMKTVDDAFAIAREKNVTLKTFTLADTMAWATPLGVQRLVATVREKYPDVDLVMHLHDTRGMGVANAFAALQLGVRNFDASVGGLGGCPFAAHSGAAGNLCTEDFVFMCEELGIETGVDLDELIKVAFLAEKIFGHPLPGSVMRGGSLKKFRRKQGVEKEMHSNFAK